MRSKWVNWELDEVAKRNKRLVPLMVGDTPRDKLPRQLGEIHILPAEGLFDLGRDLDALVHVLETDRLWLKEGSRLADRAHEWLGKQRASALLLRGTALALAESWKGTGSPAGTECEFDYISHVLAAAEECGVDELMRWETPSTGDEDALVVRRDFRQDAKRVALKLQIRALRRAKGYMIAFDAATKAKLRHHLEQIRSTVDKLEISEAKKDRLHNCIDDLDLEIGKDRTKAEAYGAAILNLALDRISLDVARAERKGRTVPRSRRSRRRFDEGNGLQKIFPRRKEQEGRHGG